MHLIQDGYTQKAHIAAVPGLYPALDLEFRPALVEERSVLIDFGKTERDKKKVRAFSYQFLASHIQSWSIDAKVTPENVAKLRPLLYDRIENIVFGYDVGDSAEGTDANSEDEATAEMNRLIEAGNLAKEAVETGRSIGAVAEERNEKN